MLIVGADVGGTFLDFVAFDEESRELRVAKVPADPRDPSGVFMQGLRQMGLDDLSQVRRMAHGTTLVTNALIQRRGAKTAAIMNEGHRDTLDMGQGRRYEDGGLWNIYWTRKPPFVPRTLRFEVPERLSYTGEVLTELRDADVEAVIEKMKDQGVESVAICFLHSYVDPSHEQRAAELVRKYLPVVPVSVSAEIVPELGEFERWSTAIVNAFVAPSIRNYVSQLRSSLGEAGYGRDIFYMESNGGIASEAVASTYPVRLVMSGPAAGVAAGVYIGKGSGFDNVITYDMGGTSTDVCLIKDMEPDLVTETVVDGNPIKTPQLGVRSVGAGGGSIAWVGTAGELNVGPRSAGAVPGPVCYGAGGTEVTVTDANVVLGRLSPGGIAGGTMQLDRALAEDAMESLGERVNVPDAQRLAEGVIKICVNNMSGLVWTLSIERGYDPRDFVLLSIGGAGPMHACPIAEELGIDKVVVPSNPGNACALGLLTSELRYDYARAYVTPLAEGDVATMKRLMGEMEEEGRKTLTGDGHPADRISVSYSADMRYLGQWFQLNVPISSKPVREVMEKDFHDLYGRTYGYRREGVPVELAYLRATVLGLVDKPTLQSDVSESQLSPSTPSGRRQVYFDGSFRDSPVYDRTTLGPGGTVDGPAIVDEYGSTTVVFPGWRGTVDRLSNLILERVSA